MPIAVHFRYGDSRTAEFAAVVDDTIPLREALRPHVRRAIEAQLLPETFTVDECEVHHEDQRVDLAEPLSAHLARARHGGGPWFLIDRAAPIAIRVLCRVDGLGSERSSLRVFDLYPSRASTLEDAIRPSELLSGVKVWSIEPKRWWIRPAWPRRKWLPWGRWRRGVASLGRNDTLELVPHLKDWRCYRRPFLGGVIAVAVGLLAIIVLTLMLSHNVNLTTSRMDRFIQVGGGQLHQIPPGKPFRARVWRWQTVWILPREGPIVELQPQGHRLPDTITDSQGFTLDIQSSDGGGALGRLDGWTCKINGFPVGDLGEHIRPISCSFGRYVISNEPPHDAHGTPWGLTVLGTSSVSVVHEIEQRQHLLNVQEPPPEFRTEANPEVKMTVTAKLQRNPNFK